MNKKVIIFGILLLIWMGFIFMMSSSSGEDSGSKSRDIIVYIVNKYDKITNASIETVKYHQTDEFIKEADYIFRKTCHFMEYLILGVLTLCFFTAFSYSLLTKSVVYSLLLSTIYAMLDEYHQTFINGRSGQITDILIDTIGAIFGIFSLYLLKKGVNRKKNKRNT